MRHKAFLSFLALFFLVIGAFALTWHFVFGFTVGNARDFQHALLSIVRMQFGDSQIEEYQSESRIMAPVLFVFFLYFIPFVLAVRIFLEFFMEFS
jgi:hypothetical protein